MTTAVQQAHVAASRTVSQYEPQLIPSKGYPVNETQEMSRMAFARDLFDKGTSLRFGSIAEAVCDRLGLPEEVGDVAGIAVAIATQNWPEVTEHGADLIGGIAEKNGNEKLANGCHKYAEVIGKVNHVGGKIAFLTAATIATAGAGGAAAGGAIGASGAAAGAGGAGAAAGGAGAASIGSIGSTTVTIAHLFQGIKLLDGAIRVGESIEQGDKQGAALGALGALGTLAGMGDLFGMDPDTCQKLLTVAHRGQQAVGLLASSQDESGKIDSGSLAKNLIKLAWSEARASQTADASPQQDQALSAGLGFLGGAIQESGSPQGRQNLTLLLTLLQHTAAASSAQGADPLQDSRYQSIRL